MPTIVTRLGKGSPLTTAELDANLTNINAETVDNSGVFNLRPSLDIDLVGSKSVSPLVSFSRGSTGTYFDSDGLLKTAGVNQPRFDYDPITKELKGLLVEESRTNLLTYSDQFDNAVWSTGANTINSNVTISPDGSQTADFVVPFATSSNHKLSRTIYPTSATWSFSVYVKYGGVRYVALNEPTQSGNSSGILDLTTGTISGAVGTTVTSVGNGWYKLMWTATTNTSNNTFAIVALNAVGVNPNVYAWTGDGTSGIYIWGAQLEVGSTPTSYIPTTSTVVTRSADQLSINKTSNWFNSTNGTLSLSHDAASGQPLLGDGSSTVISSLGAGTVNIDYSNTQLSVVTQSGQANNTTGIFNFDTDLYIGGNSTSKINNHIKYLKFYPNNVINSTPDGSGLLLDTGFALLQEDGSVIFQE